MKMKGSKVTFYGISFFLWYLFCFNYINRPKTWICYTWISFTKNRIYQAFWCNFQIGNRIFSLEIMSFSYVTVPVKHPVQNEWNEMRGGLGWVTDSVSQQKALTSVYGSQSLALLRKPTVYIQPVPPTCNDWGSVVGRWHFRRSDSQEVFEKQNCRLLA